MFFSFSIGMFFLVWHKTQYKKFHYYGMWSNLLLLDFIFWLASGAAHSTLFIPIYSKNLLL
jgi:hypothetical protein